jgi:diacylglycerol kinase (ATP)
MRVTIIHNPAAGDEHITRDELCAVLRDAGHEPSYASTRDPGWAAAVHAAGDVVLAAGGDGTISAVARELIHGTAVLAVLPLGIANNIADALDVRGPWRRLLHELELWEPMPCDVGVATGPLGQRLFLEGVGFGVFPRAMDLARVSEEGCSPGRDVELARDVARLRDVLAGARAVRCRITADGRTRELDAALVAIMNTPSAGPQLPLSRTARLDDGLLHLVIARDDDRTRLDACLQQRLAGTWPDLGLEEVAVRDITVEWHGPDAHIDDELVCGPDVPLVVRAQIRPGALQVLAPRRG